jgi:hypothetical protein
MGTDLRDTAGCRRRVHGAGGTEDWQSWIYLGAPSGAKKEEASAGLSWWHIRRQGKRKLWQLWVDGGGGGEGANKIGVCTV